MWTTPPLPLTLSLFKTHEQGDSRHLSKFAVSNSESICRQCVCFLSLWKSFQTNPDVPQSPPYQVSTWGNCHRWVLIVTPPLLVLTGFPGGSVVKNPPANAGEAGEAWVWSLGREDPLEEMATHFSILAWKISWTEEPDGLQSREAQSLTQLSMCACTQGECNDQESEHIWKQLVNW